MQSTEGLNRHEVASLLGVDKRHVARLARAGRITRLDHGRYGLQSCGADFRRRRGRDDLREARRRLMQARAMLAELDLARRRAAVVPTDVVTEMVAAAVDRIRDRLLRLPAVLGPLLAARTDPAECAELLRQAVHAALSDLSGDS